MKDIFLSGVDEVVDFFTSARYTQPELHLHLHLESMSLENIATVAGTDLHLFEILTEITSINAVKTIRLSRVTIQTQQQFSLLLDILSPASFSSSLALFLTDSRLLDSRVADLSSHPLLLQRLTVLDLSGCKVADSALLALITQLVIVNKLKKMVLDKLLLSSTVSNCICDWLSGAACSLRALSLEHCGLSLRSRGDVFIARASEFRSLQWLSVAGNQLHQTMDPRLYLELVHCTGLRHLSLHGMPLGTDTAAFLIGFVMRVSGLQSVHLGSCSVSDGQLTALVEGFMYYDYIMHALPPLLPHAEETAVFVNTTTERSCSFENEKNMVDSFCELTFQDFVDRHAEQVAAGQGNSDDGAAPAPAPPPPPLLLALDLSYNRFREPARLAPLLAARVGLGCLDLHGNR
jgi:hypothetical protein